KNRTNKCPIETLSSSARRTPHAACSGRDWSRRGDHPLSSANGPIHFLHRSRNPWPQTGAHVRFWPTSDLALRIHVGNDAESRQTRTDANDPQRTRARLTNENWPRVDQSG